MSLKNKVVRFLKSLIIQQPKAEPPAPIVHSLDKRHQRHEFTILQVRSPHLFKVRRNDGRIQLLDMGDWRFFKHELLNFCQAQKVWMSQLEQGTVAIHCIGTQENLPRGIRYTWRFSKL